MAEMKEGILIELGASAAPLLSGMNVAKLSVGGFVTFAAAKLKQFDDKSRETERIWQRSMSEISTIANATTGQIAAMRDEMADFSKEFGQKFEDVARARYDVISSGFSSIADSQKIMTASAKGAVGGLTDIATAAKVTTAVLNAYAMDASKATMVNDMMFAAVRDGVMTYGELAAQLGEVTSTAAAMKIPLSELLAFVATTSLSGVSVPETITAINQFLLAFIKQTDEAKKVSAEWGISLDNGLGPALEKISALAEQDMEAVTNLLPSVRAIKGALTGAAESGQRFADIQQRIVNSAGASDAAARTMADTYDMAQKRLEATREELEATWGELRRPEHQMWAELQTSLLEKLNNALEEYVKLKAEASKSPAIDMGGSMGAHGAIPTNRRSGALLGGVPYSFPQLYAPGRTGALPGIGGAMTPDIQNMLYAYNEAQVAAARKTSETASSAKDLADYYEMAQRAAWGLADAVASVMDYSAAPLGPGEAPSPWRIDRYGRPTQESGPGSFTFDTVQEQQGFDRAIQDGMSLHPGYQQQSSRRDRDDFDKAQQKLATYETMAGTVVGNLSGLVQDGLGNALLNAFGGGESAVARFAASTISQLISIIIQATILKAILSSIGLGGMIPFGLSSGGLVPGYAFGGYTGGSAGSGRVRGVVHGGEYVINAAATRRIGVQNLERLNSGGDTYNVNNYFNGTPTESARQLSNQIAAAIPGAIRTATRNGRIREASATKRRA